MNIDIIQLIDMLFANNYIELIRIISIYIIDNTNKNLIKIYEDIVWCYVFNNILLCKTYIIKFIKTLHFLSK